MEEDIILDRVAEGVYKEVKSKDLIGVTIVQYFFYYCVAFSLSNKIGNIYLSVHVG